MIDRLSGVAETGEYKASRCIVVGFLGSSWQNFRGYSVIDVQDRRAISLGLI